MSERTSAYTSEYQIFSKFSRTLAYAWPMRYSVTGPLRICKLLINVYNELHINMLTSLVEQHLLLKFARVLITNMLALI